MKNLKYLLSVFLFVITLAEMVQAQNHFSAVGDFSSAMNINLLEAKRNAINLEAGDEVGIFDGNVCVGSVVLTGSLGEMLDMVTIACPTGADDLATSKKDGFTVGNPILFKIWDASEQTEINVVSSTFINSKTGAVILPSPAFVKDGSSFVSVKCTFTSFDLQVATEKSKCYNDSGKINLEVYSGGTAFSGGLYDVWLDEVKEGRMSVFSKTVTAGVHNLVIGDVNGSKKFLLPEVLQPDPISFKIEQTVANCSFDSGRVWIDVNSITGGTSPYKSWIISDDPDFEGWTETMANISDKSGFLSPGEYYVRLFDSNGCYGDYVNADGNGQVVIGSLSLEYVSGFPTCFGQATEVNVKLNYDNTNHQIFYSADNGETWQTSNNLKNLIAGETYTFGYKDETIGCTYFVEKKIISPDPVVVNNIFSYAASCYGQNDGKIVLPEITGGNGPLWNIHVWGIDFTGKNVDNMYQNLANSTASLVGLPASSGEYSVVVSDSKGCESPEYKVAINQPTQIGYDIQGYNSIGDSCAEGRIQVQNITGGVPFSQGNYEIRVNGISKGKLGNYDSGKTLFPGNYEITVSDSTGCTTTMMAAIGKDITPVSIVCPNDTIVGKCLTQPQINAIFEVWIGRASATLNGGCKAKVNVNISGAPDLCGGSATVTWNASDANGSTKTCTALFKVPAPDSISIEIPKDTTVLSCNYAEQKDLQLAFENWVDTVNTRMKNSITGGCSPVLTNNSAQIIIPGLCKNSGTPVTWTVKDICTSVSYSATFHVTAPKAVSLKTPKDTTVLSCNFAEQKDVQLAFEKWVASVNAKVKNSITGGCSPVLTNNSAQIIIPGLCNNSGTSVTWTVKDLCVNGSYSATFYVTVPNAISIEIPKDTTMLSCNFAEQRDIQLAFGKWVASVNTKIENSISGGCNPELKNNSAQIEIPDVCINWDTIVTWIITDLCDSISYEATFSLNAPGGDCPQHFHTVWEGTSGLNHMNINIVNAKLDGHDLETGDEIGVFDGNVCVGYGKVSQTIGNENILGIVISADDGSGNGFTPGNAVSFKVWDCSQSTEYIVQEVNCFTNQLVPVNCSPFQPGATAFVALGAFTVPIHFETCWTGNGLDHMNINIIDATWDDLPLEFGDEVAVFDGEVCVGVGKLVSAIDNNHVLSIKVSGTNGSGCGFVEGNKIIFKYWDASENMELKPVSASYFDNQLNPVSPKSFEVGATVYAKLTGVTEVCLTLEIEAGWSLFSIPVLQKITELKTVFQPLIENGSLVKIQDDTGNSMENWGIFGGWTNNIGDIQLSEGYKINMAIPDTLRICGTVAELPYPLPLPAGWSIIGFPALTAADATNVVQQLIDSETLIKVQDEDGNSLENWGIFGGWTNNIGNFVAGAGYKIKLATPDTLWISENYPKSTTILPELVATTHFQPGFEGNGVDHMNINLVNLSESGIMAGDEIGVFDGEVCVGAAQISNQQYLIINRYSISIPVSAADNIEAKNGFTEGNPFTLKLWNSRNNQEFVLEPEIVKGTSTFTKHETTVASLEKYATTGLVGLPGSNNSEIKCYPNPFSEEVTIEINLAADAQVQVEILNQLGQKVKTIVTKKQLTTGVNMIIWNGRNENNQLSSNGIYHLRIEIDDIVIHRKIVLSK